MSGPHAHWVCRLGGAGAGKPVRATAREGRLGGGLGEARLPVLFPFRPGESWSQVCPDKTRMSGYSSFQEPQLFKEVEE